jgi:antitoxin component of RelBE/YafQ-DinJ toxin-antitoxin module
MSVDGNKVAMSIRMNAEDKEILISEAAKCGLDVSSAVRMILELTAQRLRAGGDFLDATYELKQCFAEAIKEQQDKKAA